IIEDYPRFSEDWIEQLKECKILLWCINKEYSFYENFCIARTKYKHIVLIRQ
ncbi:hypothetical protein BCR33DRAFT_713076, partial [Rhizoclosmatium globosum]